MGLTNNHPPPETQAQPPEIIELTMEVHRRLLAQLYAPGEFRSGPLFGSRNSGVRRITQASRGVPPGLISNDSGAFHLDARYVLGLSDILTDSDSEIDWVGHWLIAPHGHLGSVQEHLDWMRQAQTQALADEDIFLLTLGREEESVEYRAFILQGQRVTNVPVVFLPAQEK
ncbi:hypothetical protein [Deinococcus aquatilis]|uniref:hypothetical protein n=1 Tax=Deinococcus aquatilis TaxID=519440 RepID=UPI00037EC393|nr:hypothetical protein [Deinococcus aquatilis]